MTKLQMALGSVCPEATNGYFKNYEENVFGKHMKPKYRAMLGKGSGSELKATGKHKAKAAAVYSSSMLAYNAFHWIDEKHPLVLTPDNKPVKFTHVYFEVKLRTLKKRRQPANMDVLLVSDDGKVWLMIESKFTEYLSPKKFVLSDAYLNADNYYPGQGAAWVKYVSVLKKKMLGKNGYCEGIKQNLCHMIAIRNLICPEGDETAIECVNALNKDIGLRFSSGTRIYFWNLVFVPDPKRFEEEYAKYDAYSRLWLEFSEEVMLKEKIFPEFDHGMYSYSSILREIIKSDSAPKSLKKFLERRYLQFAIDNSKGEDAGKSDEEEKCGEEEFVNRMFEQPAPKDVQAMMPNEIFQPDYRRSVLDILKSFEMEDLTIDPVEAADRALSCYGDDDESVVVVRKLKGKKSLMTADYLTLADACQKEYEDQIAALTYAKAISDTVAGAPAEKGEALAKLADHYMTSEWPKQPWREWDVMKAMDLLVESLSRGYRGAIGIAEKMRQTLFEDDLDDVDVDDFIRHYAVDALCFAGFCLGVGLGWKKDTAKAAKLYEHALSQGYVRASHYLNEIRTGRV